jgi:dipeptidyl aminopeptidase/acylaminoacyl peptidase
METGASTARPGGRSRALRAAIVAVAALLPLTLMAQGPVQEKTPPVKAPATWADEVLAKEGYASPPPELASAVLAPRYLNVALTNASPDKRWFLDEIGDGPVPMKTFSKPFHELGGQFIDFKASRARSLTIRNNIGIQIISATDGTKRRIEVPAGARVSNATWSPDGKSIAYFVLGDDSTQIWIADVATGKSRQLTRTPVLATLDTSFDFTDDGKQIAVVQVPDGRRAMPEKPVEPTGPRIRITESAKNRLRTYPSLMSTPYDLDLLEWHATGQLALVDLSTGAVKKVGQPAMIRSVDPSPDGTYLRVTRMTKPFSYIVPVSSFGSVDEVWDQAGKMLVQLSERPLNLGAAPDDTDPTAAPQGGGRGGANQAGKREISWRPDGTGLTYLEQEPAPPSANGAGAGGRAGRGAAAAAAAAGEEPPASGRQSQPPRKDRVYQWLPPFGESDAKAIYENNARMTSHRYSPDLKLLFYRETSGQTNVDYAVYLDQPAERHVLVRYRSSDFYANPGSLASTRGGGGGGRGGGRGGGGGSGPVLLSSDGSSVFYEGTLYDKDPEQNGPRAFLDKVVIKTGEKSRVFETSNSNVSERITTIVDPDAKRFIISSESPTQPTQYFSVVDANRKQLTNNEDIAPDLSSAPRQRFTVSRADGFTFWVKVTLPPGYQQGTRLPAIFWFYPSEFATQDAYDEPNRNYNKNAFPNFGTRSMQFFVRLGYAVVEPDSPIVGPQGEMNNNYENDLRNDLSAVIDELDRRAIIDRQRLAIGGHSYGAFSTVNAMVHTPFFKAGIAGDGNYNRTFTPLGFQNERRDLWEAPNVYLGMSPFLEANHLTGALLMYHGMGDQNVGTDPDNSIRLFHALNGLGKTAALYMYPLEDHGPASKETLLDLWARWAAWLDKYVKNPQPVDTTKPASRGGGGGT